jgi:hypothetical protein
LYQYEVIPNKTTIGIVNNAAKIGVKYANFAGSFIYFTGNTIETRRSMQVKNEIHPTDGALIVKISVWYKIKHSHFEYKGKSGIFKYFRLRA